MTTAIATKVEQQVERVPILARRENVERAVVLYRDALELLRQADMLRREHKELYLDFCDLVERAERMFYDEQFAALALWLGPQFLELDARLRSHEERENELICEAYDGDIGVGD